MKKSVDVKQVPVMSVIPGLSTDSVPGFRNHVWAPDVIQYRGRWWLPYSCSTFGKKGSAIGLLSNRSLAPPLRQDEGCIVTSREKCGNMNAIDPNFVIEEQDQPWLLWGSFWYGIQLARLDTTMHIAKGEKPWTIARRFNLGDPNDKAALTVNPNPPKNPTFDYAGPNAIEAPFIYKHRGWYYLFLFGDYCCQGAKSTYRVAVGRSKTVDGPYLERNGIDMHYGGGNLFIKGDKKEYEAAGYCAAYTFNGEDIFVCHIYSVSLSRASVLIQRPIRWTSDGWPEL